MDKAQGESPNLEIDLLAEITRLHALLEQTAADTRTAANRSAIETEDSREKAAAAETRHVRELTAERALTAAARADAQAIADQAESDADLSRKKAAATDVRHAGELDEERARTATARADLGELQHRIKNTFATVQAIANATLRPNVPYEDARAAFNSRLAALANVQDLLFERNWSDTRLKAVIDSIIAPHAGISGRLRLRGPEVEIGPKTALVFGLALNELATNALKYGALSNSAGYVEIAWTREPDFRLRWHERSGPPVASPTRKGFGSQLIRDSIPAQINGTVELEFNPRGLIWTVHAPAHALLA